MDKFDHIDEKTFLENYATFTIEIRPYIIQKLCREYKEITNPEQRDRFFLLVLEQWLFLYETFEGFFNAIKNRKKTSVIESLTKNLNLQNLYEDLRNKNDEQILNELSISLKPYDRINRDKIKKELLGLANFWRDEKIYKVMRSLIPCFNKLKHRLLVYRKNGSIAFVLEKTQEEILEKKLQLSDSNDSKKQIQNIDYFIDMAKGLKTAILFLIKIRLLELR